MVKSKPKTRTWIKNHPLEGDGLVTGFYNFLFKRNAKTMKACKDVMIPDTIVFDHNFPRGWYTSDKKSKEISKKQGKELDAASIFAAFSKPPDPSIAIVASYMSSYEAETEDGESEAVTQVEFFTKDGLEEFLARKVKREGILQKFLAPKGLRNSVIQAVWSPRVCIVQRRTNVNAIKDKLLSEKDPYSCAVTYEGPSHFSEEGTCAGHTTEEIKEICSSIVQHFFSTEHKYITRMVLYFKVDTKDQVWLLWCGSLRVSDRDQPSQMPLNLAPRFQSPGNGDGGEHDEEVLHDLDLKHSKMSNDTLFYTTFCKAKSPRGPGHTYNDGTHGGDHDHNQDRGSPTESGPGRPARKESFAQRAEADWYSLPGIQDQYNDLMAEREFVLAAMDDIFYEAYGHFLKHDPPAYNFEVDRKVALAFGIDTLQEMMNALKIDHALLSDDAGNSADEELSFTIPNSTTHGPIPKIGEQARRWIVNHYARKEQALKEEAASVPIGMHRGDEDDAPLPAPIRTDSAAKPARHATPPEPQPPQQNSRPPSQPNPPPPSDPRPPSAPQEVGEPTPEQPEPEPEAQPAPAEPKDDGPGWL